MLNRLEVKEQPPVMAEQHKELQRATDENAAGADAGRETAEMRSDVYGKNDCPYGWVCVAEQHEHDLSPIALIDVYSLPEDTCS